MLYSRRLSVSFMSSVAGQVPSHGLGPTMVDTMVRPLNSWAHDPHAPRHTSIYPQDHPGHGLRLPPPSSLVTGTHSSREFPNGREPAYKHGAYPDSYAVPSPIHHTSPQLPSPAASDTNSHMTRRPVDIPARLSPAHSSTASDRSEDLAESLRLHPLSREQSLSQPPRAQPPVRQVKELPPENSPHYIESTATIRPQLGYPNKDVRLEPLVVMPPPNQTWSPKSESRAAPERMRISDLLSGEPRVGSSSTSKTPLASTTPAAPYPTYRIRVRQQPVAARSCGFGERDRRVIDPPPIIQVTIDNPNVSREEVSERLKHQFAVMHCTIWNETGDLDCSAMPEDYRQQRRLMGTVVSSPFVGMDENNEEGCFFCFPDLSCRTPGSFRLRFSLVVIDPLKTVAGSRMPICAVAMSDVFTVYNAKDFPGMQASTALTKRLKEQGCLISIKKGNDKNNSNHAHDDSDDDDGNDENGGSSRRKRQRKS